MRRDAALAAVGLGGVLLLAASARGRSRGGDSAPSGSVRIDPEGVIRENRGGVTTVYDRESLPEAFTETEVFDAPPPALVSQTEKEAEEIALTEAERAEIDRAIDEQVVREKTRRLGLPDLSVEEGPIPKVQEKTPWPPPGWKSTIDLEAAEREVRNVARHIYNAGGGYKRYLANKRAWAERAKGTYSRKILRDWQDKAGLIPDGLYGPHTRNRMLQMGAPTPPPPLFVVRR